MSNQRTTTSGGIGCLSLLGILFVGLKLTDFIDWDWIWVLAPFWSQIIIFFVALLLIIVAHLLSD